MILRLKWWGSFIFIIWINWYDVTNEIKLRIPNNDPIRDNKVKMKVKLIR